MTTVHYEAQGLIPPHPNEKEIHMAKRNTSKETGIKVGHTYETGLDGEVVQVTAMGDSKRHPGKCRVSVVGSDAVALVKPEDLKPVHAEATAADEQAEEAPAKKGKKASNNDKAKKANKKAIEKASKPKAKKATAKKASSTDDEPKAETADRTPAGPRKSLMNAAILVLGGSKKPMNAQAIIEKAEAGGLYERGEGKTPEATLYSAMLSDKRGRVEKAGRGLWQITDAGRELLPAIKKAFAA